MKYCLTGYVIFYFRNVVGYPSKIYCAFAYTFCLLKNIPDVPNVRTLRKRFGNVNENRLDSTKPCVSGKRNKYLFALTKKFSSIAS